VDAVGATTQIETSGEVAVLPMRAGKANAIGSAFLDQLSA
jgi:hypothetical protein